MIGAPQKTRHEMVEALAREICKAAGQKPDDRRSVHKRVRGPRGSGVTMRVVLQPVWRTFAPEARVALKAIDKLGYALFKKTPTDVLKSEPAVDDLSDPITKAHLLRKIARQHLSCDGR